MATRSTRSTGSSRAELIADTALTLLAERGMRGLTHRAVDELAGLPQGSTSNHARTRQALLEAAVRRQAEREARVLTPDEMPVGTGGRGAPVDALALALHRYLTGPPNCSSPVTNWRLRPRADRSYGPTTTRRDGSSASHWSR